VADKFRVNISSHTQTTGKNHNLDVTERRRAQAHDSKAFPGAARDMPPKKESKQLL
jgi:hypothetical protein